MYCKEAFSFYHYHLIVFKPDFVIGCFKYVICRNVPCFILSFMIMYNYQKGVIYFYEKDL